VGSRTSAQKAIGPLVRHGHDCGSHQSGHLLLVPHGSWRSQYRHFFSMMVRVWPRRGKEEFPQ